MDISSSWNFSGGMVEEGDLGRVRVKFSGSTQEVYFFEGEPAAVKYLFNKLGDFLSHRILSALQDLVDKLDDSELALGDVIGFLPDISSECELFDVIESMKCMESIS